MKNDFNIIGSGGGKSGGSAAQQSPTTLRSSEKAILLDALCEGPIVGLVNGAQSIYLNKVPMQNADGSWNFNQVAVASTTGTLGSSSAISSTMSGGTGSVSSTTTVAAKVYQATPLVQAVSTANVDTLQVTLNVPSLYSVDSSNGNTNGTAVEFTIGVQSNGGGYVIRVHDTFNGVTYSNYARTYTIPVTGAGPFDIQVTRITGDSGSSALVNDLYWQDFSAIISTNMEYRNTAMAYTVIDAQQFGSIPSRAYLTQGLIVQIPSNYNPTTRVYTGTWNGTFSLAYTNNPAWCFYDLITNDRYGLGDLIPAATVNKWQLYQIAQYCDGMVPNGYGGTEPRFTCNLLLASKKEAYTWLQNMASIFRGMIYWGAGSITATQDAPATPVMSFTPANVIGGAFSYQGTSLKARHTAVMVAWNDPNEFYSTVMEYVQDDTLVAKFGVVQASIVAVGCTSRGQAHRIGQWLLYTENLETEAITFKCAMDGAFLSPGAIIQTSDPMRAGVRMGGRVVAIDSTNTIFTLDAVPPATSGLTLQCALPDGTMGSATVSAVNGDQVTITAAFPTTPLVNAIYLLSENTVQPEQWRVVTLAESAPNELLITATTYNPSKYAYIEDGMPLVPAQISTLSATPVVPTNLALGVSRYNADTGPAGVIGTLSWTGSASSYIVTMQQAGGNLTSQTVKGTSVVFNNLNLSVVYTFTVTAVSALGIQSQPASLVTTPTAAQIGLVPLPTASALSATGGVFMITLSWTFTTTRTDIAWAEIWGSNTNNLSTAVRLTTVPWPTSTWQHNGLTPGANWFYWVRVVDLAGDDGPYFPTSTTAGIQGSPSTDPSAILTQLTAAIGTNQLAASLATPIAAIPGIQTQQTTNTAGISSLTTTVSGISAKYVLQVDANGHVAGLELASGAGQSQIVLLANALAFYTGSATYPLLEAGNVNGVASVGINGQLIVDGSITANSINSNGLSIKDTLGNVILAAGTPLASQNIAAGLGGNLVPNADMTLTLGGWTIGLRSVSGDPPVTLSKNNLYFTPPNGNSATIVRTGPTTGTQDLFGQVFPVIAGQRYEIQGKISASACPADLFIVFLNASSVRTGEFHSSQINTSSAGGGGSPLLLSEFTQIDFFAVAPANSTSAFIAIRQYAANNTATQCAALTQPLVTVAGANQSQASPWSASNFAEQINSANASTYIAAAAIGQAQIGNAAIGTAQIQSAAIGTAQIANGAIQNAQIGSLVVQTANIADLNVNGQKISGVVTGSVSVGPGATVTVYTSPSARPPLAVAYESPSTRTAGGAGYIDIINITTGYFQVINFDTANTRTADYAYI